MNVYQMREALKKKYSDRFADNIHDKQVVAIYMKLLNEGKLEPEGAPKHLVNDGVQLEMDLGKEN